MNPPPVCQLLYRRKDATEFEMTSLECLSLVRDRARLIRRIREELENSQPTGTPSSTRNGTVKLARVGAPGACKFRTKGTERCEFMNRFRPRRPPGPLHRSRRDFPGRGARSRPPRTQCISASRIRPWHAARAAWGSGGRLRPHSGSTNTRLAAQCRPTPEPAVDPSR